MKLVFQYIFMLFVFFSSNYVSLAKESNIAAIVNGEAILHSDLNHRISLIIQTAQMGDTPTVRKQLKEQLLKAMINEALMRQVADQYKIEVSEQEINEALEDIARQNNMDRMQLEDLLKTLRIPKHILVHQIKAQLGWRKYITEKYSGNIQISNKEIKLYKKTVKREQLENRYHLEEIVIPCGNDSQNALQHATNVCAQLKQGARFESMAQQVSSAASALNGGDLGFMREPQLPKEILSHIKTFEEGQISNPIKVGNTYHIVRLKEKRSGHDKQEEVLVTFMQAILPLPPNGTQADLEKLMNEASHITHSVKTSAVFKKMMKDHPSLKIRTAEKVPIHAVHPDLLSILLAQPQGEVSQPVQTPEGIMFFALEKREVVKEPELNDDMIRAKLASERINQFAAMNIKKLRQHAYIEQRI